MKIGDKVILSRAIPFTEGFTDAPVNLKRGAAGEVVDIIGAALIVEVDVDGEAVRTSVEAKDLIPLIEPAVKAGAQPATSRPSRRT